MTKNKEAAIVVKDLHKTFKLPHEQHSGLKQKIVNIFSSNKGFEEQQVLKGISFEIEKGDFFGIVGRNGSGKSTLLKLLAGIYTPDEGLVKVNGSLTPFIELGVGFNPELTGRENVYMNGALLGFDNKHMDSMYDSIVEFAELDDFMDQKLKNYSSGMQVRLAFSIAIRAESDILLLDEVLAVGDEAFQRKCFEYFAELKKHKKTVILVTHSMESMRKFCTKAILVKDGSVVMEGTPEDVANSYTQENFKSNEDDNNGLGEKVPYFKVKPVSKQILSNRDELQFNIEYNILDDTPVRVFFSILDQGRGGVIFANGTEPISGKGRHNLTYVFPLKYYNNTDILVNAAIDEVNPKKRIAFTNEANSCRFAIRNIESDNGLLRRDNGIHGHWIDHEDYMYKMERI